MSQQNHTAASLLALRLAFVVAGLVLLGLDLLLLFTHPGGWMVLTAILVVAQIAWSAIDWLRS